jgi:hypothetical protein
MRCLAITFCFVAACTESEPHSKKVITTDLQFQQLVDDALDLETCRAETAGTGFNCLRALTVCANGGFLLIVTDIVNEGRYTASNGVHVADRKSPGDGPAQFTFTLTGDMLESTELAGDHSWERGNTAADSLADACGALEGRFWW